MDPDPGLLMTGHLKKKFWAFYSFHHKLLFTSAFRAVMLKLYHAAYKKFCQKYLKADI